MNSAKKLGVMEEIKGCVKRIMFKDRDLTPVIIGLSSSDIPKPYVNSEYPNTFVAVGTFIGVVENQTLNLKGKWTNHNRYGWRFAVEEFETAKPESNEEIILFLSSGLFKGIGKKIAKVIVDEFGKNTLDILEYNPEALLEVKGISKKKLEKIITSYQDTKKFQELALLLKPYKISNNKIVSIHLKYGERAIKIISENPYRLCDDINGIGFIIADSIARAFDINYKDSYRIRAGILHTLKESANNDGHVYLPLEELMKKSLKLLYRETEGSISKDEIQTVLRQMTINKDVVIQEDSIYLPIYYFNELYVGKKVREMLETKQKPFKVSVNEVIAELEQKHNINYASKQKEAFNVVDNNNVVVITGGPGTGKTTIIKGIIEIFKKNISNCKISLVAPTGRAAKRMQEATKMEAKTIHRLLEYSQDGFLRNEDFPILADLIIVDESSMIDLNLCASFLRAVKPTTRVIFVGDTDQLPSVGAGNIFRDFIESGKIPTVCLNEIFRQANTSKIVINADKINKGFMNLELANDFVFVEENDPEKLPKVVQELYTQELKKAKNINEVQILSPLRAKTSSGVDNLNVEIQKKVNPSNKFKKEVVLGQRIFRLNDKVMQYKNNYDKEVYNGDIGIISEILVEDEEQKVMVDIDNQIVKYSIDDLEELGLSYATTIHKSQGSEYDIVIIPMTMQHYIMLQRNLLYTAVTRAKKKVILVGERKAVILAIKNNKITQRYTNLKERI